MMIEVLLIVAIVATNAVQCQERITIIEDDFN